MQYPARVTKRQNKDQKRDKETTQRPKAKPPDNGKDKTKTQDEPRKDNINTRLKETNKDNTKKTRQGKTRSYASTLSPYWGPARCSLEHPSTRDQNEKKKRMKTREKPR